MVRQELNAQNTRTFIAPQKRPLRDGRESINLLWFGEEGELSPESPEIIEWLMLNRNS